jgi:osmoprotectant transport system ATP-binding protein
MSAAIRSDADGNLVEIRGVNVRLGGTDILHDIDLTVPAHRTVAIIGASGSGKSTLLQVINALIAPASGSVRCFGAAIADQDAIALRRRIGYALQETGLFPHLRVADNIQLPARLAGWPRARIDERVAALLALMDLPAELLRRYPPELSGGQRQRIGICRAMMLAPPLLLLDEAFSGLDPITKIEVHERFVALRDAERMSCVLVTHDMAEASLLADDLVILQRGRVVRSGTRDAVIEDPRHPYAARLVEAFL